MRSGLIVGVWATGGAIVGLVFDMLWNAQNMYDMTVYAGLLGLASGIKYVVLKRHEDR